MRWTFLLTVLFSILFFACQEAPPPVIAVPDAKGSMAYDSTLAAELGADDYGMKQYVVARAPATKGDLAKKRLSRDRRFPVFRGCFRKSDDHRGAVCGPGIV